MADVFTTIKKCALFDGFSELEILSVLSQLGYSIKSYPAGEIIYHDDLDQSGSLGCVYLILSGEVSLALLRDTVLGASIADSKRRQPFWNRTRL